MRRRHAPLALKLGLLSLFASIGSACSERPMGSASDGRAGTVPAPPPATAGIPGSGPVEQTSQDAGTAPEADDAALLASPLVDGIALDPVLTVGQRFGPFVWAPAPDGIGAYRAGNQLVLHVNHEIDSQDRLEGFRAAMVSRLRLSLPDFTVEDLSYPVDGTEGYQRLCSATWAGPEANFRAPGLFLTGEETGDGRAIALDVQGQVHPLPRLGRFSHENAVPLLGLQGQVGVIGLDDARGKSELYLTLAPDSDALLAGDGTLHVFATDAAADVSDLQVNRTVPGRFLPVPDSVADAAGADLQAWVNSQRSSPQGSARVFPFVRLEDGDVDRRPGASPRIYFVDTGTDEESGTATTCGAGGGEPCDPFGSIYRLDVDPSNPTEGVGLTLLARSSGHQSGWASPDNVATDAEHLMLQEDPAYDAFNRAARIYRIPLLGDALGAAEAIVELVEDADGCGPGADCWESSGILSLATLTSPGTWIFAVQAHGMEGNIPGVPEGGQLLLLRERSDAVR